MNAKIILFPTDFSSASDAGLPLATALCDSSAKLIIAHVQEPPIAYGGGELYYGLPEPDHATVTRMLHDVKPADEQVRYEHRMLFGDPAKEIVKAAEDEMADLIVLGTHGRTGLTRMLMGSVAEQVVRTAGCPVVTVKEPASVRNKKERVEPVTM